MDKYVINTGKKKPYYSCNEISKHNKESSCWIIIDNKVYDVTQFLDKHPGGAKYFFYFVFNYIQNKSTEHIYTYYGTVSSQNMVELIAVMNLN